MHYLPDRGFVHPTPSEITPRGLVLNRRQWMQTLAAGAGAAALPSIAQTPGKGAPLPGAKSSVPGALVMDKLTPFTDASTYNNFYEFGTDKSDPARYAGTLKTRPWAVQVEGEIKKPGTYDLDALLKLSPMEERIYRLRCVEGWSMVIPWVGYSLAELIKRVEPTGNAKYVQFVTLADKAQMRGLAYGSLEWPYVEGLRMDEAMHPLALLSFGMYGEVLPNQNGAPVRVVLPWKYGFKSGKSIVKIRFVEKQPKTSWEVAIPSEYGFYSNVNPKVDHPRWSQATERRIGEDGLFAKKRPTLMFNGYEPQVGQLYAGMDLKNSIEVAAASMPSAGLTPAKLLLSPAAKPLLFVLLLLPFAQLLWGAIANTLGPNPAEALIRGTGDWTLRMLCLTLAVTPLRQMTGLPALARFRRMIGLFSFFYAVLHFLCFAWLDMGLDVAAILADIPKRPFILVGTLALLLMLPLAATSFNRAIKALGAKRWQLLHKLVYAIVLLGLLHFFWMRAAKANFGEVAIYAVVITLLLGWRVWHKLRATPRPVNSRP